MEITALNSKYFYKYIPTQNTNRSTLWKAWQVVVLKYHQITHFVLNLFHFQWDWVNARAIERKLSANIDQTEASKELVDLYNTALTSLGRGQEAIAYRVKKASEHPEDTNPKPIVSHSLASKRDYVITLEMLEANDQPFLHGFDRALSESEMNAFLLKKFEANPNVILLPTVTVFNISSILGSQLADKLQGHQGQRFILFPCLYKESFSGFVIDLEKKVLKNFKMNSELNELENQVPSEIYKHESIGKLLILKNTKHPKRVEWSSGYWVLFALNAILEEQELQSFPMHHILEYVNYHIQQRAEKQNAISREDEGLYRTLEPFKDNPRQLLENLENEMKSWHTSTGDLKTTKLQSIEIILVFIEREKLWTVLQSGIKSFDSKVKESLREFCKIIRPRKTGIATKLTSIAL